MVGIKNIMIVISLVLSGSLMAQITSGRIVYERKVNLQKMFQDNERVKQFLPEDMKYRIEDFELYFTDSSSAFLPIESNEGSQGFMKYLTTHNKIFTDLTTNNRMAVMDMWGQETIVNDTIPPRRWKVTESKRKFDGYMARKAIVEINDSTRIYAWFAADLVTPVGPEGFDGLPGTILGLATEDGSIVYFAKKVEAMEVPKEKLSFDTKGKDVYTKEQLKAIVLEKMGKWVKPEDIEGMFTWL
jgi:GLPGLI family protein